MLQRCNLWRNIIRRWLCRINRQERLGVQVFFEKDIRTFSGQTDLGTPLGQRSDLSRIKHARLHIRLFSVEPVVRSENPANPI